MIEINNLTTRASASGVDEEFLKRICQKVLEKENKKDIELSIALVGQKRMRELNKKYRNKNKAGDEDKSSSSLLTDARVGDVLSFQYDDSSAEIVICLREVKKNAKKINITFEKELTRVLIHGILHTIGYDHEKGKVKAEKMRDKEETYVKNVK